MARGIGDRDPHRAANPAPQPGAVVRELSAGELREARWMFGANVNFASVRIHRGRYFPFQPDNTAMAPNGHVYFPPPIYKPDFSGDDSSMALLLHELTHVWQTQSGVWLKFRRLFRDGGDYAYTIASADADLKSFKVEEQAAIVEDWYRLRHGLTARNAEQPVPLATYEAVIRRAIPVEAR